ncbi:MAG: CopG family transcriptional regulator [Alphaproteobacteria bacterium]|nr:CopG family transcriptional regulator [Alphaproteobacteria bacterium]
MRTIVDIPRDDIKSLDAIAAQGGLSRAEVVRRAVSLYLEEERAEAKNKLDQYFGLFRNDPTVFDGLDGLAYQEKMRAEWNERDFSAGSQLVQNRGLHDQEQTPIERPDK